MILLTIGFIGCVGLSVYLYRRVSLHEMAICELLELHKSLLKNIEVIEDE